MAEKQEQYLVSIRVFVTGPPTADFDKAAQNAADDINSLLASRTINTADCNIEYQID